MIQAIVYTSQTGTTKEYAQLLAERISVPVMEVYEAMHALQKHAKVIYLGWIMAGVIQGYAKAKEYFEISYVCAVGMSPQADIEQLRTDNHFDDGCELLLLQGGCRKERLKGMQKMMMRVITGNMMKKLKKQEIRSAVNDDFLNLLEQGGDRVRREVLDPVVQWYEKTSAYDRGQS